MATTENIQANRSEGVPSSGEKETKLPERMSSTFEAGATVKSIGELKEKHPKAYKVLMQGMAMEFCSQMRRQEQDSARKRKERLRNSQS